jgi:hypothetical protein
MNKATAHTIVQDLHTSKINSVIVLKINIYSLVIQEVGTVADGKIPTQSEACICYS